MKVEISIKKEHFYFLTVLMTVLFVAGVSASLNPGKTVGHDPSEIVEGTFGLGNFLFPNNVFSGNLTVSNAAVIGNLSVINNITAGNLTVENNVTIKGNLSVGGNVTIGGNITFDKNAQIISKMTNITFVSNITLKGTKDGITLGGVRKTSWPSGISSSNCYWVGGCDAYYFCNPGDAATGVYSNNGCGGDRDYVYVYCCKISIT